MGSTILNQRERRRQQCLAATRDPTDCETFTALLAERGADPLVARFLWTQIQPYYFAPLTPHPDDRLGSQFRIDPDDISDIGVDYAKKFGRKWRGEWHGPDDPTLAEFAIGLEASTIGP